MAENNQALTLKCQECHRTFRCLEKMDICIDCLTRKMHSYDPEDYDKMVEQLLQDFRMSHEFELKCRKCGKYFKTTKRGLFNYGFECDDCGRDKQAKTLKEIVSKLKSGQGKKDGQ